MKIFSKYSRLFLSLATVGVLMSGCKDDEDPQQPPQEDPQPTITAINPDSGPRGTTVEISGDNFNPDAEDHVVAFNGAEADIIGLTNTLITVTVPQNASTGNLSLSTGGQTIEGPVFTVAEPETGISFITPTSGVAGQQVRIHGHNFTEAEDHVVYFNSTEAIIRTVTDTYIIVVVPEGVSSGAVSLNMGGAEYAGPDFTVLDLQSSIDFSDGFRTDGGMTPMGQAFIFEGGGIDGLTALRLTPNKASRTGVAYYGSKVQVADGFETTFDFRISRPGQPEGVSGELGAEGFAFIIQNESLEAYGNRGPAMGYGGITNTVVVEFDIYQNEHLNDPNGNHISVQATTTKGAVHPDHHYSIGYTSPGFDMIGNEFQHHTARLVYTPGTLAIYLNDSDSPFEVELSLEDYMDLDAGSAFVGFSASTSHEYGWAAHDILTWTFESGTVENGENGGTEETGDNGAEDNNEE